MSAEAEGFGEGMFELVGFLLFGVVLAAFVVVRLGWRHPKVAAVVVVSTGLWVGLKYPEALGPSVLAAVLVAGWCVASRRGLKGVRRRGRYRRVWRHLCAAHRLSWQPHPKAQINGRASYWELVIPNQQAACPKLEKVECGPWVDRLRVRMLPGQTPEDWEREAPGMAHAVGARDARVRVSRPGRVTLELFYDDPLTAVIPALPIAANVDLLALPMGVQEDGQLWTIPLLYCHWLFAGVTNSGKGSLLWSLIRALCPAIRSGEVEVWAIDPKGGMELAPGRPLFARFAADEFEAMADLLDQAVAVMRARAQRLAGVTRKMEPTVSEPLIVVLIDEFANLSAYLPDRKLKERITQSVSLLLTQGRAVGVTVVGALQDPRKDIIVMRNLFPGRVGLRLDEPVQCNMVLGDAARDQGARCDEIPESLPGVGFVRLDGVREPVRVRAAYVTDDDIAAMVAEYGTGEDRPALEVVA